MKRELMTVIEQVGREKGIDKHRVLGGRGICTPDRGEETVWQQ